MKMQVGTKFKGQINKEVFEIVEEKTKGDETYFKIKHLRTGKIYELTKNYVEHLLVEII